MIENAILNKIFSHYISDNELQTIQSKLTKGLKTLNYSGRKIKLYYNNDIFIKIDTRTTDQEKYIINNDSLLLGKFPKEILINNILRKELPDNIVKIINYYFNNKMQIIIMENTILTLEQLIKQLIKQKDTTIIDGICRQLFMILAILQEKFNFMHNDLLPRNILLRPTSKELIEYTLDNKKYTLKTFGYIPILIDFATSGIHKMNGNMFSIYDTESLANKRTYKPNEYRWEVLDNNIYDPALDLYYFIQHLDIDVPIIKQYINQCHFYPKYSKDNPSAFQFAKSAL